MKRCSLKTPHMILPGDNLPKPTAAELTDRKTHSTPGPKVHKPKEITLYGIISGESCDKYYDVVPKELWADYDKVENIILNEEDFTVLIKRFTKNIKHSDVEKIFAKMDLAQEVWNQVLRWYERISGDSAEDSAEEESIEDLKFLDVQDIVELKNKCLTTIKKYLDQKNISEVREFFEVLETDSSDHNTNVLKLFSDTQRYIDLMEEKIDSFTAYI
jgi:hypothetical protein